MRVPVTKWIKDYAPFSPFPIQNNKKSGNQKKKKYRIRNEADKRDPRAEY